MTNLRKLTVSLTKHGAHKVATLLREYDKDKVLSNLSGAVHGVNIELAQARTTLAADERGKVPSFWNTARQLGSEAIDGLVLLAIVTSHHQLISAMRKASGRGAYSGTVRRRDLTNSKAFTNFAHVVEQLGYSTSHSPSHISYDFHKLFKIDGLNRLAEKLFERRLKSAGWDGKTSVVQELCRLKFYEVFSVDEQSFTSWFNKGVVSNRDEVNEELEDADFFLSADDSESPGQFKFRPGHREKDTGKLTVMGSTREKMALRTHNAIQNSLFKELAQKYGKDCVSTEHPTGQGTSIDLVVKTDSFCWFYEIKVAPSVRAAIRQAIPQLLEYAYWPGTTGRADRLFIVGTMPVTKQAERYLSFLREKFGLQIEYLQHGKA